MLLICKVPKDHGGTFSLGEIKKQIELKNVNIKYNFYILQVKNEEKCKIDGLSSNIMFSYPEILNFTSKDSITIDFLMDDYTQNSKGIKLNPEGKELDCINGRGTKRCTINKSHFENKKSGYYFTHHLNHLNESIIYHEASPIYVILPDDGDKSDESDKE